MEVTQRPIGSIKPYEKNAKAHPVAQVEQIAASIKEFGFNQPIVVDKEGVIIVGHGRYAAAQHLGLEIVPVIEADITEEQAKAYRLADNRLNETPWNMDLVIAELKETRFSKRSLVIVERVGIFPNTTSVVKKVKQDIKI